MLLRLVCQCIVPCIVLCIVPCIVFCMVPCMRRWWQVCQLLPPRTARWPIWVQRTVFDTLMLVLSFPTTIASTVLVAVCCRCRRVLTLFAVQSVDSGTPSVWGRCHLQALSVCCAL